MIPAEELDAKSEAAIAAVVRRLRARLLTAQKAKETGPLDFNGHLDLHRGVVNRRPRLRVDEEILDVDSSEA